MRRAMSVIAVHDSYRTTFRVVQEEGRPGLGRRMSSSLSRRKCFHGVTVNVALLLAFPPAVLTETFPVLAPAGTVAVIVVPEFTV